MKIQQWLFELLRKQSVTDGRTDARTDNVKTVYPLQKKFAGGINRLSFIGRSSEVIKKFHAQLNWAGNFERLHAHKNKNAEKI